MKEVWWCIPVNRASLTRGPDATKKWFCQGHNGTRIEGERIGSRKKGRCGRHDERLGWSYCWERPRSVLIVGTLVEAEPATAAVSFVRLRSRVV